jgi:hypothetical protein
MDCSHTSTNLAGCSCSGSMQYACYSGPAGTRNVGACHDGMQTCAPAGEFGTVGACSGDKLPGSEAGHCSDGIDNDCNGATDCADSACAMAPACQGPMLPPLPDGGCLPPDSSARCPAGAYYDDSTDPPCCLPCTAAQCATNGECCLASVCKGTSGCTMCVNAGPNGTPQLDPACKGRVDSDCDDYPEDCDELCCPCRPAAMCKVCPQGQVECDDGTGNLKCVDVTSDPNRCGACDTTCDPGQKCVSAVCM